jgi:uncharacterized membrane protein
MSKLRRELLPVGATIVGVVYFFAHWSALPEMVPIHFGLLGQPDGWAPKGGAILMPVLAVFMYIMMSIGEASKKFNLPWEITDSNREKIEGMARNLLFVLKVEISVLFAYIQIALVQTALQRMNGLGVWFGPVFIGAILLPILIFFFKGRQVAGSARPAGD